MRVNFLTLPSTVQTEKSAQSKERFTRFLLSTALLDVWLRAILTEVAEYFGNLLFENSF